MSGDDRNVLWAYPYSERDELLVTQRGWRPDRDGHWEADASPPRCSPRPGTPGRVGVPVPPCPGTHHDGGVPPPAVPVERSTPERR